ncbi:MAG: riboflavin synthase [Phycisphaerae bacterium]
MTLLYPNYLTGTQEMFTGIVRHVGEVLDTRTTGSGRRLKIRLGPVAEGLKLGDSVAVNGACLTASEISATDGWFDVVSETLERTGLGELRPGSKVNLEPALAASDTLDGHIVQGHVDGRATVAEVRTGGQWVVRFHAPPELTELMVPKGSVAVDGVSLTLAEVTADGFSVALIPTTLAETSLANLDPGRKVNIETDVLGKYVRKYLRQMLSGGASNGLSMDQLRRAGFL